MFQQDCLTVHNQILVAKNPDLLPDFNDPRIMHAYYASQAREIQDFKSKSQSMKPKNMSQAEVIAQIKKNSTLKNHPAQTFLTYQKKDSDPKNEHMSPQHKQDSSVYSTNSPSIQKNKQKSFRREPTMGKEVSMNTKNQIMPVYKNLLPSDKLKKGITEQVMIDYYKQMYEKRNNHQDTGNYVDDSLLQKLKQEQHCHSSDAHKKYFERMHTFNQMNFNYPETPIACYQSQKTSYQVADASGRSNFIMHKHKLQADEVFEQKYIEMAKRKQIDRNQRLHSMQQGRRHPQCPAGGFGGHRVNTMNAQQMAQSQRLSGVVFQGPSNEYGDFTPMSMQYQQPQHNRGGTSYQTTRVLSQGVSSHPHNQVSKSIQSGVGQDQSQDGRDTTPNQRELDPLNQQQMHGTFNDRVSQFNATQGLQQNQFSQSGNKGQQSQQLLIKKSTKVQRQIQNVISQCNKDIVPDNTLQRPNSMQQSYHQNKNNSSLQIELNRTGEMNFNSSFQSKTSKQQPKIGAYKMKSKKDMFAQSARKPQVIPQCFSSMPKEVWAPPENDHNNLFQLTQPNDYALSKKDLNTEEAGLSKTQKISTNFTTKANKVANMSNQKPQSVGFNTQGRTQKPGQMKGKSYGGAKGRFRSTQDNHGAGASKRAQRHQQYVNPLFKNTLYDEMYRKRKLKYKDCKINFGAKFHEFNEKLTHNMESHYKDELKHQISKIPRKLSNVVFLHDGAKKKHLSQYVENFDDVNENDFENRSYAIFRNIDEDVSSSEDSFREVERIDDQNAMKPVKTNYPEYSGSNTPVLDNVEQPSLFKTNSHAKSVRQSILMQLGLEPKKRSSIQKFQDAFADRNKNIIDLLKVNKKVLSQNNSDPAKKQREKEKRYSVNPFNPDGTKRKLNEMIYLYEQMAQGLDPEQLSLEKFKSTRLEFDNAPILRNNSLTLKEIHEMSEWQKVAYFNQIVSDMSYHQQQYEDIKEETADIMEQQEEVMQLMINVEKEYIENIEAIDNNLKEMGVVKQAQYEKAEKEYMRKLEFIYGKARAEACRGMAADAAMRKRMREMDPDHIDKFEQHRNKMERHLTKKF